MLGHTEVKVDFTSSEMDGASNAFADGFVRIDVIVEHTPPEVGDGEEEPAEPASAKKDLTLEIFCSKAGDSSTGGEVKVQFEEDGKWSPAETFFTGIAGGASLKKKFSGRAGATRVSISTQSSDAFGYWKFTANGKDVVKDPNGERGRPYQKCPFWIDGNQVADHFNVFTLPPTEWRAWLEAKVSRTRTISSTPAVDLVFCIDMTGSMGTWRNEV